MAFETDDVKDAKSKKLSVCDQAAVGKLTDIGAENVYRDFIWPENVLREVGTPLNTANLNFKLVIYTQKLDCSLFIEKLERAYTATPSDYHIDNTDFNFAIQSCVYILYTFTTNEYLPSMRFVHYV